MAKCTSPIYRLDLLKYPYYRDNPLPGMHHPMNDGYLISRDRVDDLVNLYNFNRDILQVLPCKQCLSCRLNYSKEWAIRCQLESLYHDHNYFITLTYDDYHLPKGNFLDFDGSIKNTSLSRRDVQLWLKRFRKLEKKEYGLDGLKVFYCGEYGDLGDRPHYHVLLFGAHEFDDLELFKASGSVRHYKSDFLSSTWSCDIDSGVSSPIGFSSICEFSFDTAAYTSRYMLKKQKGLPVRMRDAALEDPDLSDLSPRMNCFCGMSNRPGIARAYYEDNKDHIYEFDKVPYHKDYQVFMSKPPAYFDRLYDIDYPEDSKALKDERQAKALLSSRTDSFRFSEDDVSRAYRVSGILDRKNQRKLRSL